VMVDDAVSFVYIVGGNGKVARRNVEVGSVSAQGMSITAGLTGTEQVVETAGAFLSPGEVVRAVRGAVR